MTLEAAGGRLELARDLDARSGWQLSIGGVAHSYVDLDDPTHLEFEYVQWIGAVLDAVAPPGAPLDTVHVGGGAGTLARYVAATRPASRQVVLEADPVVADLARERLGLRRSARLRVRTVDGRRGLRSLARGAWDVVIRDAFVGAAIPEHLVTAEFALEVRAALRPDGVYVANLADRAPFAGSRREAATLLSVWAWAVLLAEPATLRKRRGGNVVLAASDRPLPVAALSRAAAAGPVPARVLDTDEVRRFAGDAPSWHDGQA